MNRDTNVSTNDPTTPQAQVQAFANTYDDDPRAAFEAIREARPGRGAMWSQDAADAFEKRCADVYARVMAAADEDVRERADLIVGSFEPQVMLGASEKLAAVRMAETLDDNEADLLHGLLEALRDNAEYRGEKDFIARMERAIGAREDTD